MALRLEGFIDLPPHRGKGGFDHAAVHRGGRRLFVAHTANDAVDVVDLGRGAYERSLEGLTGVAGALVDEGSGLVFTSNRGEDTVGILHPDHPQDLVRVPVGVRPNGLAYDPGRGTLLAANVGEPDRPGTHTLSVVDVERGVMTASIPVAGRTRWAVYDPVSDAFLVNIAAPASIVVVPAADPTRVDRVVAVPAAGPHGLDLDADGRLYCACDAGWLLVLEPPGFSVSADLALGGSPDVIFLDRALGHLYVAVGDPGLLQVFDLRAGRHLETVETEIGAHTIGHDPDEHRVYAFLPGTHRAAVYRDAV